jgi:hypothetical protein
LTANIILSSKTTTGLSSRIAALNKPFASYGVAGSATFRPGTCATRACRLWLCCAADRRVAPSVVRTVSGALRRPPDM